jgi:hypothetical protein
MKAADGCPDITDTFIFAKFWVEHEAMRQLTLGARFYEPFMVGEQGVDAEWDPRVLWVVDWSGKPALEETVEMS